VELYLRARHEYRKFWQENQAHALALFAQAEALAPGDAMILSGKALAKARSAFFTGLGVDEAVTAAEQAIAVAPNLGEARLALGSALLQKGEWKLAVRQLRAAVVRAPGLADAHAAVGRVLLEVGDLDEAERRLEAAMELDPRTPLACEALVRCHGLRGNWARSDEVLKSTPPAKRDIAYWTMRARMLLWKRDSAGAAVALEQLRARDGGAIVTARLLLEIVASRRPPATLEDRRMLDPERAGSPRRKMFFLHLEAEMLAYLYGDLEPVLASVTRLVDHGLFDICWMDGCPLLAQARTDARFSLQRAVVKHRADEILNAYRAG
jgi:serine/threonine-protein kinase